MVAVVRECAAGVMMLTSEQRQQYAQQGYLLLPGLLSAEDIRPLLHEIEQAIDQRARQLLAEGRISQLHEAESLTKRLTLLTRQSTEVFDAVRSRNHRGDALLAMLAHPKLLAVVEALLGPEIMCHPAYVLRPKLPDLKATQEITVVPWHQDGAYFEERAGGGQLLTVWVALSESTVDNGCVELVPGTPALGTLPHRNISGRRYLDIPRDQLPREPAVQITAQPGDVLLFSQLTLHRALPNRSDEIRWSMDMRYHPAGTPTGFAKEPSFLIHSRQQPDEVVRSWAQLDAIRARHDAKSAPRWKRWPMLKES